MSLRGVPRPTGFYIDLASRLQTALSSFVRQCGILANLISILKPFCVLQWFYHHTRNSNALSFPQTLDILRFAEILHWMRHGP